MEQRDLTKLMIEKARVEIREINSKHFLSGAIVSIGDFKLKGWTIAPSQFGEDYCVLPPRAGKNNFVVYLEDKDLFSILRAKIVSAYEKSRGKI